MHNMFVWIVMAQFWAMILLTKWPLALIALKKARTIKKKFLNLQISRFYWPT